MVYLVQNARKMSIITIQQGNKSKELQDILAFLTEKAQVRFKISLLLLNV